MVLFILAIAFINYVLEDDATQLVVIENREEYSDIINFLENTKDDSIIFELPSEGEMQDYNTYYGNKILLCLNKNNASSIETCINKNYVRFLEDTEGDAFESVEKISADKAIVTLTYGDTYWDIFDNDEQFEIKAIVNADTKIVSKSNLSNSIDTIENSKHDMIMIDLDPDTIYDENPVITVYESSDN